MKQIAVCIHLMSRREGDQLSSYERERLANIAQNEALLKQLGLKEAPELFPNKRKLQPPQNVVDGTSHA